MITFQTLIKVAPFDTETRTAIERQMGSLTPDQELKLTQLAWEMIATTFQARLNTEFDLELLAIREGKKQYDQAAFKTIEQRLLQELAVQLESADTEEQIEQVKQSIQEHTKSKEQQPEQNTN